MQRLLEPQSRPRVADSSEDLGGIALFFDVENILLGIQGELDVHAVTRFLGERGEVMILRAYADWGRYRRQQRQFLEEGVQMVFLPTYGASDKNRTDTAICVDAMEILYTRSLIDTFCIISGDSDFGILANRLRDHGKRIIGISARSAASPVLVKQCHEFVYYETLVGQRVAGFSVEEGEGRLKRALERIVEEVGPEFRASVLKDRMRKQDATFSERNYGASSFTRFLANYDHLVTLSDGGLVRLAGDEVVATAPQQASNGDAGAPRRSHTKLPALDSEVTARARGVLLRTVLEASTRHGAAAVPLSRLKDTMQAVAPDFDEVALGFKTFTQFLLAFPDVVIVDRPTNSARANEGIIPVGGELAPVEGAGRSGPERRRRPRKSREELAAEVAVTGVLGGPVLEPEARDPRDLREPREPKDVAAKEPRDSKDVAAKEPRESKDVAAKEPRESKEPKDVAAKEPREPKDVAAKEPREPKARAPELPLLVPPEPREAKP